MQTDLTTKQCEDLLKKNHYAHLGCVDNGQPYVIPITFVYKDGFLYSFSLEGHKIDTMRNNPNICIQVEHIGGEHEWQSVICWGAFEELTDPHTAQEAKLLMAELHGQAILNNTEPAVSRIVKSWEKDAQKSVAYRMKPVRITGKAEKA